MTDTTPAEIRAWALKEVHGWSEMASTAAGAGQVSDVSIKRYQHFATLFRAVAALAARAEADSEGGWRGMDSAPRDGTAILVACNEDGEWRQEVVYFESDNLGEPVPRWVVQDGPVYGVSYFTNWRPLPAPPKENADG